MNTQSIVERIREIIDDETLVQLKEELNSYHEADLADIFQELKPEERLQCFKLLDLEKAALSMFFLVSIYLLAFLMVSTVPFFSFKKMSYFKARPFQALIVMVIFISILVLYFEVVSFIMITAYITIGLLFALFKMIKGKPKTVEEKQQEN